MYLFFEAYPIAFQQNRGWNDGVGALPFLSITGGVIIGALIITWTTKTRFARKLKENDGKVIPEERLPPMILGSLLLPAGLFWYAWTSSPNIIWVPQVLAGIPIGCGILMIFMQGKRSLRGRRINANNVNRIELHHRHILDECQQRYCSKHFLAKFGWWWIPTLCHCDVQQVGRGLGDKFAWLPLRGIDPSSHCLLLLRREVAQAQ